MIQYLINEELFRLCPFEAWLTDGETIQSATVTVTNSAGVSQPAMVSDVAPYDSTGVRYKLKAIAAGYYTVRIDAVTTNGQKLAHRYTWEVKA